MSLCSKYSLTYGVITNDVTDYIKLLVRNAPIICNHPLLQCASPCVLTKYREQFPAQNTAASLRRGSEVEARKGQIW